MDRIMLVDEDLRLRQQLERLLIDSGYRVTQKDVIKASKLGAFDYIQKPFLDSEMLRLKAGHIARGA